MSLLSAEEPGTPSVGQPSAIPIAQPLEGGKQSLVDKLFQVASKAHQQYQKNKARASLSTTTQQHSTPGRVSTHHVRSASQNSTGASGPSASPSMQTQTLTLPSGARVNIPSTTRVLLAQPVMKSSPSGSVSTTGQAQAQGQGQGSTGESATGEGPADGTSPSLFV